jgi:hypothetical protein
VLAVVSFLELVFAGDGRLSRMGSAIMLCVAIVQLLLLPAAAGQSRLHDHNDGASP